MSAKLSTFLNGFSPIAPLIAQCLELPGEESAAELWKDCYLSNKDGVLKAVVAYVRPPAHDFTKHPNFEKQHRDTWTFLTFSFQRFPAHLGPIRDQVLAWLKEHKDDQGRLRRAVRNYDFKTAQLIRKGQLEPPVVTL